MFKQHSMRNLELIQAVYKICQDADYRGMFDGRGKRDINIARIAELIEKERPEISQVEGITRGNRRN